MPSFPFLFAIRDSAAVTTGDVVVPVRGPYAPGAGRVVVARPEALELVDYLLSLRRAYPVSPSPEDERRQRGGNRTGTRSMHTMP